MNSLLQYHNEVTYKRLCDGSVVERNDGKESGWLLQWSERQGKGPSKMRKIFLTFRQKAFVSRFTFLSTVIFQMSGLFSSISKLFLVCKTF